MADDSTAIPAAVGSNGPDITVPATNGNETGAIIPTAQGSNGDESGNSTPVTPVTPPITISSVVSTAGGSSSSSSGSSGSFYGGGSYAPIATVAASPASMSSCPLLTVSFLKLGANNDGAEVAKLQAFLKDTEGLNVAVNGVFDQNTEAAVSAFQDKYLSDIMGPWGATRSSGIAYITTIKKINQIACNTPLNLSVADLSIINAYKQAEASGTNAGPVGVNQGANNGVAVGPTIPASASSSDILSTGNSNVAAVGQASLAQRFWNFIVGLFHR